MVKNAGSTANRKQTQESCMRYALQVKKKTEFIIALKESWFRAIKDE